MSEWIFNISNEQLLSQLPETAYLTLNSTH